MSHTNQAQPFIIHSILMPSQDSSFINSLILSYSQQLQFLNPHFLSFYKQKQEKLSRHNEQLKLLNEMKEDHILREQVLEQIQLKEYQKQYQALLGSSNLSQTDQKPLSHRLKSNIKQHSSFHFTNREKQLRENSIQSKAYQKSSFAKEQQTKKFRSSLIKSGSFSSIKKKISPFQNHINSIETCHRNSQDANFAGPKNLNSKGEILKKKGVTNLGAVKKQLNKNFQKGKEIVKNQIFESGQKTQEKQESQEEEEENIDLNQFNIQCSSQIGQPFSEQLNTKRTNIKTVSSNFPQLSMKDNSVKIQKNEDSVKKEIKYYMKENKQNPYHISNFMKQLNSHHCVSQYNQLKSKTKRSQRKIE